jgi:hypothetical protein
MIRLLGFLTLGTALLAAPIAAQKGASVAGRVVHKTSKAGIVAAEVQLAPGARASLSDAAGHFRFDQVQPGNVSLVVKRLGFAPESASFPVLPDDDLELLIELEEVAQPLDTVSIKAAEVPIARAKLAGFYERRRVGIGKFIDASVIEKEQTRHLADLITSMTPGSKVVRAKRGFISWIATNRDSGVRPSGVIMDPVDRALGADPYACYPDVYIDGAKVYGFGSGARLFDINSIGTADVAAIEFYVGSARVPVQYNSSGSACGVLLIWTR